MQLADMITCLKQDKNFREIVDSEGNRQVKEGSKIFSLEIQQLSYDSRAVDEATLFFAKGQTFQSDFLKQAVENGLRVYVSESLFSEVSGVTAILVNDVRKAMACISRKFFGFPDKQLKIVAFTGTKGKTTSAYFTKGILEQAVGKKVALLSTMESTLDGRHFFKSELTTPESLDLYRMMRKAVQNGMTHLVMEVSSQAYKLQRVYGLTFDVGVFLNLSPDHISPIEHPTFEDYFFCKRQLLRHSRQVVLNRSSDYFEQLLAEVTALGVPTVAYGREFQKTDYFLEGNSADWLAFQVRAGSRNAQKISTLSGSYALCIPGDFNQENALAAMLAASFVGGSRVAAQKALPHVQIPGRMERLVQKNGAAVYVDYAHNRVSLELLLQFVKKNHSGKLIVVLGSTGEKAISRRRDFGEVLSMYADVAILTADDPNFEGPLEIAAEIASFISSPKVKVEQIAAREKAIQRALSLTETSQDVVVLAGKGADKYQVVRGEKLPYEGDLALARQELRMED